MVPFEERVSPKLLVCHGKLGVILLLFGF
jgi:hypothetical protein